ncbi:hypothetical protein ACT3SZ_02930 [Corynebacterium sp. AOP40-9SA-29]
MTSLHAYPPDDEARQHLRQEAAALADDSGDKAEASQVLHDMESLRTW